jgi:sodium/hydrogen antiporter
MARGAACLWRVLSSREPSAKGSSGALGVAIVGLTLLLIAAVSQRLSSTPITPAMVAVAVGVLVGPLVLDYLTVQPTSSTVRTLAEATLAVVLFSDSSRVNLLAPWGEASMPVRLLGVGLPLTIALGGLLAVALFGAFSLSDALILGVILAPTDAGLGSAVVTDARLPHIVRQSLNVESGLNDGICVPLLLILLATFSGGESHRCVCWSRRSAMGCSAVSLLARLPRRS